MTNSIERWAQVLGALGIVAGLVLVTLELRQSALLVRAELGSGSMAYRQTLLTGVQGEELAAALAQAVEDPGALTTQQQVILDAWYDNIMGQVLRQRYLLGLGVFENPIEPFAKTQARTYFGNAYAQAWWAHHHSKYSASLVDIMGPVIAATSPQRDRDEFDAIRRNAIDLVSATAASP